MPNTSQFGPSTARMTLAETRATEAADSAAFNVLALANTINASLSSIATWNPSRAIAAATATVNRLLTIAVRANARHPWTLSDAVAVREERNRRSRGGKLAFGVHQEIVNGCE